MQKISKILGLLLAGCLLLTLPGCGAQPPAVQTEAPTAASETTEAPTEAPAEPPTQPPTEAPTEPPRRSDSTRPDYDLGNCRNLEGEPYVLLIFLDDEESQWDPETISRQTEVQLLPGLGFLEARAGEWGVNLKFQVGQYATDPAAGISVKYEGTVVDNIMEADYSADILEQAAVSLGFASGADMDSFLREQTGREEIVYLLLLNKDGRSYSINDSQDDGTDELEYCVIFTHFNDYTYETGASSVAHEVLHLFGAEDYYDPYGTHPSRAALAETLYHDDIMLRVYVDISYNTLEAFTAYTVGWLQELPEECRQVQWWG